MVFFSSLRKDDEEEMVEFYLRICFDVFLEVLHFGNRRKLAKLERVGRRCHWIIEKWFLDVPFLRLNLELIPAEPRYLSVAFTVYVFSTIIISLNKR